MSFQSFGFLAFLAVTLAVCLTAGRRDRRTGRLLLTLACLVFYVAGAGWRGLLVLAAGTVVTAGALQWMRETEPSVRRRALALGCCWHVGVLLVFKDTGFFTGGSVSIGWVPLGLSFFIGEIKIIPPAFLIQQIFSDPSTMNTSPDAAQGLSEATV